MNLTKKIINPASVLIEQTAADLCAEFYEIGKGQGLKSIHKTHKAFVHHNLERFIPKAIEILTEMLHNPATPDNQKEAIYDALLERANDPDLVMLNEKIEFKEPEKKVEIITTFDRVWAKSRKDTPHG
jgi:hypothetical protein